MIRAAIIDDEQHSIDTLNWKIENYCEDVEVVRTFSDPVEGAEFLKNNSIDLLFIDIEMPMMSGFDVLEEVGEKIDFEVIFVTAYDSFGIKAIKFSAIDYLLKPVQNKELMAALEKYANRTSKTLKQKQVFGLLSNIKAEGERSKSKIGLVSKDSVEFVYPSEILFCEADSNYTIVHLCDQSKRMISKTLKDYEGMLSEFGFIRPHNSFLINLEEVREYKRQDGGSIIMSNGQKIPVSKHRKDSLKQYLGI